MLTPSKNKLDRPGPLLRFLFRLPKILFHLRLNWIFSHRLLMLVHVGRRSGLRRRTVVETLRRDRESDRYILVSGYGERSQWFRNIVAPPDVEVRVGFRRRRMRAVPLAHDQAVEELVRYHRRYPRRLTYLSRMLGLRSDGTEEDARDLAGYVRVVAVTPIESAVGAPDGPLAQGR